MVLAANGTTQQTAVTIGNGFLRIDDIERLVLDGSPLSLSVQGLEKVEKCFQF